MLKVYARLVIKLYCRSIYINRPDVLKRKGPLLLAANHPNSFFDGIILTTLFDNPVYSLARGDVFKYKRIDQFLRRIQLLPIYRTSEGIENLSHNYTTFDACQKTFEKKGIILIFSEGRCENEWHLRPLKKGTARLASTAWQNNIPLEVIPTALNYSSFKKFGKEVHICFGEPIPLDNIMKEEGNARQLIAFNEELQKQLQQLVYEIDPADKKRLGTLFHSVKNKLFALPALLGWLFHAPLYYPCLWFTQWRFRQSGHFDSVLHSLLILLYPVYFILMIFITFKFYHTLALIMLVLLPVLAWTIVRSPLSR